MFARHFQAELGALRALGRELAETSPGLADTLARPGTDPDVERLLEGFAFLAARLRERADDAVPEVWAPLAEMMAPEILAPIPAATIVQLHPARGRLRQVLPIERGAVVGSRPVEGTSCVFRTTADVLVRPLWVERCHVDESRSDAPELVIAMASDAPAAAYDEGALRFWIGAPTATWTTLVEALARSLAGARILVGGLEVRLDTRDVRVSPGLDEEPLLPWTELASPGARAITEHFVLPQRSAFFEVRGIERVPAMQRSERLELRLSFRHALRLPERLAEDAIRLHCVPAINAFECSGEPIRREPLRPPTLIRAAGLTPRQAEVLAVHRVEGLRAQQRGAVRYQPFHEGTGARFAVQRRRSPIDGGTDAYLWLDSVDDAGTGETVSLDLTCTNRALPASLRAGDVCVALPRSPSLITFGNPAAISHPVPAPIGEALGYRLLGRLSRAPGTLSSARALREELAACAIPESVDASAARACARAVGSIRSVQSAPVSRVLRGALVRGVRTVIELDEGASSGAGEAWVLGCALDRLYAAELPINTFHALVVRLFPSTKELSWAPRLGTRTLI